MRRMVLVLSVGVNTTLLAKGFLRKGYCERDVACLEAGGFRLEWWWLRCAEEGDPSDTDRPTEAQPQAGAVSQDGSHVRAHGQIETAPAVPVPECSVRDRPLWCG